MGLLYVPTFTIKINHSWIGTYTVRPMDGMGLLIPWKSIFSMSFLMIPKRILSKIFTWQPLGKTSLNFWWGPHVKSRDQLKGAVRE